MPTPDSITADVAEGIFEMHSRLALRTRNTDALAEAMVARALDGAELSATGRFLLFSAIRHAIQHELPSADVRRIGGCRRCGGTGRTEWHDEAGSCVWCYEYHSGLCAKPCIRCAGVGTEPMSVAEIISSGIRVQRGAR